MIGTLHLVDASPYIFRAFHSLPGSIRDPGGRPVNAVLGFAGFLLRLIDMERPTHLGLCFDGSLTTSFRNDIYPDYKAHREAPPVELEAQIEDCLEVGEAFGMATLLDGSFEADDLIASLAARAAGRARRIVIVSSDKDLAQLVRDDVCLLDFARQTILGPTEVRDKLGVRPEQVPDLLGLAGDKVDNIPGVRGVGEKTARRLLESFDRLEDVLDNLERVAELPLRGARSVAARLEAERETALLSKRLATLSSEAPVPADPSLLRCAGVRLARVEALCCRLGFERLLERVRGLSL